MEHAVDLPLYSIIPFVLMLGAIAVLPLVAHHFWENNNNKLMIALALAIPTAVYQLAVGLSHELAHMVFFDYVPFIVLLGSLFIITGGIYVEGKLAGKPGANTIVLVIGAIFASIMGTTGAAMLLIRPLINMNKDRRYQVHTVLFFIAIAANCGGLLTPLGDPPLFMMYLRGVPFEWFAGLIKEWAFVNVLILIIYYLVDSYYWKKEHGFVKTGDNKSIVKSIRVKGSLNFIYLMGVVLAVAFINPNTFEFIAENHNWAFLREGAMALMAILSLLTTRQETRVLNHFSWEPILEVAYLFIGIFITMVPALEYLKIHSAELGIDSPPLFYYATGLLSGFLDNTPTAVTFYSLEVGMVEKFPDMLRGIPVIAGIPEATMEAICTASVFFGAMTYIGNGPNFMVKAIAESRAIKMPDFFSYMYKFSIIVLLPIFILAQLIFIPW